MAAIVANLAEQRISFSQQKAGLSPGLFGFDGWPVFALRARPGHDDGEN
jgi:hypothetical protein